MKKTLTAVVSIATALSLSGCAVFYADGTCGTISGEANPRFILEGDPEPETSSPLFDGGPLFGGTYDYASDPTYTFSANDVTNAFAVRALQAPMQLYNSSNSTDFAAIYVTEEIEGDTKPVVTAVDTYDAGAFDLIRSASVDYGPFGGFLPTFGAFDGDAINPVPFMLPVDVYALCMTSPDEGQEILYDSENGLLRRDGNETFYGELADSSSLRTYPGFAGEDFVWSAASSSGYSLEVEPTVHDSLTLELAGINVAIVPWFEGFGEPTGNAAEDSSRAFLIWVSMLDEIGPGTFGENLFLSDLDYDSPTGPISFVEYPSDPQVWNEELSSLSWSNDAPPFEDLGPVTRVFAQVMAVETFDSDTTEVLSFKYDFFDISHELQPVPYLGPVVTNDPETAQSGSTVTYTGSDLDEVTSATIAGQAAAIVSKSASSLTLRVPAGLNQGMHDVVLNYSTTESLTLQNGLVVQDLMKVWTQLQSDNTVKMYAKNILGEGKIQFFHNSNEIAWVRATNALNPKLRQANGSSYLVRTRELVDGKNTFEIYQDGKRIWRAAYWQPRS